MNGPTPPATARPPSERDRTTDVFKNDGNKRLESKFGDEVWLSSQSTANRSLIEFSCEQRNLQGISVFRGTFRLLTLNSARDYCGLSANSLIGGSGNNEAQSGKIIAPTATAISENNASAGDLRGQPARPKFTSCPLRLTFFMEVQIGDLKASRVFQQNL